MNKSLPELYIERDLELNLDPCKTIINHLKKLNYYNINIQNLKNKFIEQYLIKEINSGNYNLENNKYVINTNIIDTIEYKKYDDYLNNILLRSIILSKYINNNNIQEFYNNCTNDELIYLGY
jgi:hypothetical protein